MQTATSLVLIASLALMPPAPDEDRPESADLALPATCIATTGVEPLRRPRRWHNLLPTVVFGVDYQPSQTGQFNFDGDVAVANPIELRADGASNQVDDQQMTRWTVSFRWNTGPSPASTPLPTASPVRSGLCSQFLVLRSHRPQGLAEAVDHWVETARIQALLGYTDTEEVSRD